MKLALVEPVEDWSSCLTRCHKALKEAEEELRLAGVHWNHVSKAKVSILQAQYALHDVLKWVDRQ